MKDRLQVVCALKVGKSFSPEHVWWLKCGVDKYLNDVKYKFWCISDVVLPFCETFPLTCGYPKWWSKIELFSKSTPWFGEKCLYFDLDTLLVGNIGKIAKCKKKFNMLKRFDWCKKTRRNRRYASGIMMWKGDFSFLFEEFDRSLIKEYHGDQDYIEDVFDKVKFKDVGVLNDYANVVSYKEKCRKVGMYPKDTEVVCFHGKPRPWKCKDKWVKEIYDGYGVYPNFEKK